MLLAALPWALVVRTLDPGVPRTAFSLAAFSPLKVATALAAIAPQAAPAAGLAAAAAVLLVLSPATFRRRRAVLGWAVLLSALLLASFAFSRLDPAWHARWSWDRLLVVPLAVVIPVLAEALSVCVAGGAGRPGNLSRSRFHGHARCKVSEEGVSDAGTPWEEPMKSGWLVKGGLFVLLCSGPLLVAIPASGGSETPRTVADPGSQKPSYTATVLERKDGSVTLKREGDGGGVETSRSTTPGSRCGSTRASRRGPGEGHRGRHGLEADVHDPAPAGRLTGTHPRSKRRSASSGESAGGWPSTARANARGARRARLVERLERQRAVSLSELLPVGPEDERKVRVRGGRKAERPLERDLARRRAEEVRAAHDLGHALRRVVHDDRELVRERPVRALHDEVADVRSRRFRRGNRREDLRR